MRYQVIINEYHGGKIISNHRSLKAALKIINREYQQTDCACGRCFDLFDSDSVSLVELEIIQVGTNFGYEIVVA